MKHCFKVVILFFMLMLYHAYGENILTNGNFSLLNAGSLPVKWELRNVKSPPKCVKDNILTIIPDRAGASLAIQRIYLPGGIKYHASGEIKGSEGAKFMFYISYRDAAGEVKELNTRQYDADEDWEKIKFVFTIPEGVSPEAQIVLRCMSGSVDFRSITLEPETDLSANLVRNHDFANLNVKQQPTDWETRLGGNNQLIITDNIANFMLKGPEIALMMQRNLAFIPGHIYTLSYEVKGKEASYTVYLEWLNAEQKAAGKTVQQSFNAAVYNCGTDWEREVFTFMFPSGFVTPYLVIWGKSGEVSFRNIKITDLTAATGKN